MTITQQACLLEAAPAQCEVHGDQLADRARVVIVASHLAVYSFRSIRASRVGSI